MSGEKTNGNLKRHMAGALVLLTMPTTLFAEDVSPAQATTPEEAVAPASPLAQDLQNALNEARQALATAVSEEQKLRQQLAAEQAARSKAEKALSTRSSKVEQLQSELTQLHTQLETLKASLEEAAAERENLKKQVSALERKLDSVEQALAETNREKEHLAALLAEEKNTRSALEEKLKATAEERASLRTQLSETTARLEASEKQLAEITTKRNQLQQVLGQYREALGETKRNLADLMSRQQELNAELQRLQQEQLAAGQALEEAHAVEKSLRGKIGELQARLPGTLGGTASLSTLKASAGEYARKLRELHRALRRSPGDEELLQQADAAADNLRRQQLLIATALGAGSVYQIRPEDTLALLAARFYGNGNRWPKIYEANRHVLDNPDRLLPRVTLILP